MLDLLLNENPNEKSIEKFSEIFLIIDSEEIKEDKETKKKLAKSRKNLREIKPNRREDIIEEEKLSIQRIVDQTDRILNHFSVHKPNLVVVEDYSFSSKGSIVQMAELKGALRSELYGFMDHKLWIEYDYINLPIKSAKKIVGMNGNANKDMIFENIQRFGIDVRDNEDDRNDAISLVISIMYGFYYRMFGFNFPEYKLKKDKNIIDGYKKTLESVSSRIGSQDDIIEKYS
jgi:hypothetical protein